MPKALASTVQVQYRDANLSYKRSLSSSKHTPIHVAVSFALGYITEALIRNVTDTDLDAEDGRKKTAFHWAVESGLAGCARSLLAAGVDIRTQDNKGYTAFYKSSALGYASIVKMILEHDKAVTLTKKEISCAVLSNQEVVIETYIRAAPRPADRANLMLMESSALGKPDIIGLAISFGADANVEDVKGRTALLVAVENGRSTAAQALITAGASTTVLDETGMTLLQVAASSENIFKERLEHIERHGERLAETGDRDIHQFPVHIAEDPRQSVLKRLSHWIENTAGPLTCLVNDPNFIAAMNEDREYPDIIRLLFNHGTDLGIKTSKGETLLHLAVGSAPRIKVLLELGAQVLDINARDKQGRSSLHHAAAVGVHAAMELLLANGANVKMSDFRKASTLHYAVNHPACTKLAIQKENNIKAVNSHKRTALHYFAMLEELHQEVFDQLYEAGVDPNAIDSQGMTAFYYAKHSHLGSHGFEETTRWIDTQGRRYVLHPLVIHFMLRESSAQASRDSLRFFKNMNWAWSREKRWWIVPDDEISTEPTG